MAIKKIQVYFFQLMKKILNEKEKKGGQNIPHKYIFPHRKCQD